MYLLIVTCRQITQHCTHLETIFCKSEALCKTAQIRYPIGVIINHMIINPIKTKSMTIATRQKHELSPLPFDLILNGAKIDQMSEHRLSGITIDNKLRWDSHVCKTVLRLTFLLSELRYIDTRKLFFNVHIKTSHSGRWCGMDVVMSSKRD